MKTYSLYLESGPQRKTTLVHVIDLLGCTASGKTTEEAIAAVPEAVRAYLASLRRHGEDVDPITPILARELIAAANEREDKAPRPHNPQRLTPREREILALVQRGRTNREIGATLGIEEKTVKNHINSVYSKLNVTSRLEVMAATPPETKR